MNRALRRLLREKLGRDPEPSAGIVDAQSVKTTGLAGSRGASTGAARFRRLGKDCERLPETAAGLHFVAFA